MVSSAFVVDSFLSRTLERELAAANERIKRLEDWVAELQVIGSHSGKNNRREWSGDIGWLRPGQVAYVGGSKP